MSVPAVKTESFPLTPLQDGMLFQHIYTGRPGVDLLHVSVEVRHFLDVPALERAWKQIIGRHSALRTAIVHEGLEQPIQEVWDRVPFHLELKDLSTLPEREQKKSIQEHEREDRKRGFAALSAPPMRAILFKRNDQSFRLLWSVHHIIADGRACQLILQELFEVYDAEKEGRAPALGSHRSFREYVEWVNDLDFSKSSEFWREKLKGFIAATPVFPDGGLTGSVAGKEQFRTEKSLFVTRELSAQARDLMRSSGLTLNTLVQGIWAILLGRYSSEDDIVFGATKTTRHIFPGANAIVGPLIATIPIRASVRSEALVVDWLRELRQEWLSYRAFEQTPLALIQQMSEVPQGTRLFDTLVMFESGAFDDGLKANGEGWSKRRAGLVSADTNYALTLMAYSGDELELRIGYDESQFSRASIRRMLGHLRVVLESIVRNPEQQIGELPLLTPEERELTVIKWNQSLRPHHSQKWSGACIHELFEEQVARTPANTAVVFDRMQLSYRELNERANQLAHALRALGVGPEQMVGICLERSVEMMVTIVAVLKAGGAYVPIDPAYPKERQSFMLEDAKAPVLLTTAALSRQMPAHSAKEIHLDTEWPLIAKHSAENPARLTNPDNIAYIIYTSGSTGKPKGVMIMHSNVVRLFAATEQWFSFSESDTWTLFHSFAFDFSVWEMWGALLYGGRLIVVPQLTARSPETFHELLVKQRVTILNQTPSAFRYLIEADERSDLSQKLCLRFVIFGGEALDFKALRSWMERHPHGPTLINMYGITETTVHVTYFEVTQAAIANAEGSLIGERIPDLQLYILDKHLQPAPIGIPGELFVGGGGLARGYLRCPELTAEKFIADPFLKVPGGKLYKTGDLTRYLADGNIEYLGRIDQQVKIRGFRIELGEIEAAINKQPSIQQAVVIAREDRPGDKRLVAYVVPSSGATLQTPELRSALKQVLPEYMVPSFVPMKIIPISANGKVDRKALPAPEESNEGQRERTYIGPRNDLERAILDVWTRVLGAHQIGVTDNFFDLGGHSLLAVRVVSALRNELDIEVGITMLFAHPSVEELAQALEEKAMESMSEQEMMDLLEEQ